MTTSIDTPTRAARQLAYRRLAAAILELDVDSLSVRLKTQRIQANDESEASTSRIRAEARVLA